MAIDNQTGGTHSGSYTGAPSTVHTEGTDNQSDRHKLGHCLLYIQREGRIGREGTDNSQTYYSLLSKSIAEDPDDCAATSWEKHVLRYESPIIYVLYSFTRSFRTFYIGLLFTCTVAWVNALSNE